MLIVMKAQPLPFGGQIQKGQFFDSMIKCLNGTVELSLNNEGCLSPVNENTSDPHIQKKQQCCPSHLVSLFEVIDGFVWWLLKRKRDNLGVREGVQHLVTSSLSRDGVDKSRELRRESFNLSSVPYEASFVDGTQRMLFLTPREHFPVDSGLFLVDNKDAALGTHHKLRSDLWLIIRLGAAQAFPSQGVHKKKLRITGDLHMRKERSALATVLLLAGEACHPSTPHPKVCTGDWVVVNKQIKNPQRKSQSSMLTYPQVAQRPRTEPREPK